MTSEKFPFTLSLMLKKGFSISIGLSLRDVSRMTPDQLNEYGWPCLPKVGDGLSEHCKYDAYFIPEAISIFNRVERLLKEDDKDALAVFVDEAKGRMQKITDVCS